ncbi:carboxymuconolactone decarboxylase family protein [Ectothiorhodospiraceae bacterium WFHF3C12]|nr:carboxymuconolactone decarboxylase family protein [Ectothiorhodospiraceae bacterium WFHF3C12]
MSDSKDRGLQTRREVMGDEFVNRAMQNADDFAMPVQDFVNEHAWGATWQRDDLPRSTRSLVTIAMLAALRASTELKGHVRGALRNGCTPEEIRGVILHSAVYCGAPAALEAFRAAREVIDQWDG